jgi:sulfur transfer protein SufE
MSYGEIKSLLAAVDDPVTRLEIVMDFGKRLHPIPRNAACAEISGCASRVRICREPAADGQTRDIFYGEADSSMVRGIIAIILAMANGGVSDLRKEFDLLNLNLGAGRLSGVKEIIAAVSSRESMAEK